jgi:hypothetical protein
MNPLCSDHTIVKKVMASVNRIPDSVVNVGMKDIAILERAPAPFR